PPEDAPYFIISWIMNSCDSINPDGSEKPLTQTRDSLSHAQKMRAAMTHVFARKYGLGSRTWDKSEVTGKMHGNPSVSAMVASYMVSLANRKAHAGEAPNSARAITSDVLKKLYHFNNLPEFAEGIPYAPGSRDAPPDIHSWGG
ncbi:hypothetical protein GALMADRAFT_21252, partial [Galerina marginata CBS 339.88]